MKYDYLIVGAGLFGATFAYRARKLGLRCLVIDKRDVAGGNVRCECVEGINVHRYGAHIFHTSNQEVWNFVNAITPFNRYTNSPVANYKGSLYNLPFNMNTFYQIWKVNTPNEAMRILEQQRQVARADLVAQSKQTANAICNEDYIPQNLEEQALLLVGRDIYERLVKGYTEKQWGRPCTELPPFIIKRLPVRMVFDNNYFNDTYQGIPIGGYNRLVEGLLDGVETRMGVDFFAQRSYWESLAERIVFSGKIDEFFDYRLGMLEYRSVRFETEVKDTANYQGNAVVNYTDADVPYTRIIEHKHFEMFGNEVYQCHKTVVSREYSMEWTPEVEPYYPINDDRNTKLYRKYKDLAEVEENVIFGGRLAEYKYYDMHQVMERAMKFDFHNHCFN